MLWQVKLGSFHHLLREGRCIGRYQKEAQKPAISKRVTQELVPGKVAVRNYLEAVLMEEPVDMTVQEQPWLSLFEASAKLDLESATTKFQ